MVESNISFSFFTQNIYIRTYIHNVPTSLQAASEGRSHATSDDFKKTTPHSTLHPKEEDGEYSSKVVPDTGLWSERAREVKIVRRRGDLPILLPMFPVKVAQ